jgi:hypothetical protein
MATGRVHTHARLLRNICVYPDTPTVSGIAFSAPGREKGLEKRGTVGGQNSRYDFDLMVQAWMGKNFKAGADGAAFRVIAAINEAGHTSLNQGAGAHAAGLDGYVQSSSGEAIIAHRVGGFPQHHHFGVRRGVAVADRAITGTRDDSRFVNQDGADGNLAGCPSRTGLFDGGSHELKISVHARENSTPGKPHNIGAEPVCLTIPGAGNKLLRMVVPPGNALPMFLAAFVSFPLVLRNLAQPVCRVR